MVFEEESVVGFMIGKLFSVFCLVSCVLCLVSWV